jgi:hypothetical protein
LPAAEAVPHFVRIAAGELVLFVAADHLAEQIAGEADDARTTVIDRHARQLRRAAHGIVLIGRPRDSCFDKARLPKIGFSLHSRRWEAGRVDRAELVSVRSA